jgi:hypothetical protein
MFGRLWTRFKNWLTRVRHFFFGVPHQQPHYQPVVEDQLIPTQVVLDLSPPRSLIPSIPSAPQSTALVLLADPKLAIVPLVNSKKPEINDPFFQLPQSLRTRFSNIYLNVSDFMNLRLAMPKSFQPIYANLAKSQNFPLRKLLSHAALGEWDDAEKLYKQDKRLVASRGTVFHPNQMFIDSGNYSFEIERHKVRYLYRDRSSWQIALMNEEFDIADEMGQGMTDEEKKKQFFEIFPDGEMKKHNWNIEHAKQLLSKLFSAIIQDDSIACVDFMNETTAEALQSLCHYVKPPIAQQTGLVFDTNIYVEALKLFEDKLNQFKNDSQRSFWCVRVEEHLAYLLGTAYLRPHTQGIGNKLNRTGCILSDGTSYFPFRREKRTPGLNFFVSYYGGEHASHSFRLTNKYGTFAHLFRTYVEKNKERGKIYTALFGPRISGTSPMLLG